MRSRRLHETGGGRKPLSFFKNFFLLGLLFTIPLCAPFYTVAALPYTRYVVASDSFLYLDIASNILRGHGPVLSFNFYQYWPQPFYPALPFIHLGVPLVVAFLYGLLGSIEKVVFALNLPLVFFNGFMVFLIVKRCTRDRTLSIWSALFVLATPPILMTVLRILTEQPALAITLAALLVFMDEAMPKRRRLAVTGLMLGISTFVRCANALFVFAFALAILFERKGRWRVRVNDFFFFLLFPILLCGGFILFIYLRFGVLFPEYPVAFKNFFFASQHLGGMYAATAPVLRPYWQHLESGALWRHLVENMRDAGLVLLGSLRILVFFALLRVFKVVRTRTRGELVLFLLAVLQLLATLFFYAYEPLGEFEWTRFLLLPVIALAIFGIAELRTLVRTFSLKTRFLTFHLVLGILFAANLYYAVDTVSFYWKDPVLRQESRDLSAIAAWIQENTAETERLAVSGFVAGRVYLDRPIVLPPYNKMLHYNNLRDFIHIYEPRLFILRTPSRLSRFLPLFGYRNVPVAGVSSDFAVFDKGARF